MKLYPPAVIVTGASRGLGRAVASAFGRLGYAVILGARDPQRLERTAHHIEAEQVTVFWMPLDVTSARSVGEFKAWSSGLNVRVAALINNAGIYLDVPSGNTRAGILENDVALLQQTLETNLFGAIRMTQAIIPSMLAHGYGRVVNVSSGMGRLARMGEARPNRSEAGYESAYYKISKAALNAATRLLASEVRQHDVLVNAVCPGWVRTDMGGPSAPRSSEEAARGVVWAATLPRGGPTGLFFRDGLQLEW